MYRKVLCLMLAPQSGLVAGRWAHSSKTREGFGFPAVAGRGSDADRINSWTQGGTIAKP